MIGLNKSMNLNNIDVNIIDIVFLLVMLISMSLAFSRGLLKELFSTGNWIFSGWISLNYYLNVKPILIKYISLEILAEVTAFTVIFIVSLTLGTLISQFITGKFKKTALAPTDKMLGLIFGALRALIIISMVTLLSMNTLWKGKTVPYWLTNSYCYIIIQKSINVIELLLPNSSSFINTENLNFKNIQPKRTKKIIDQLLEPPINIEENNDQYYKPSETEAMDRLINIETIDENNEQ